VGGGGGSRRLAFQARACARREATDEWLENGEPAERTRNEVEWPTIYLYNKCQGVGVIVIVLSEQ